MNTNKRLPLEQEVAAFPSMTFSLTYFFRIYFQVGLDRRKKNSSLQCGGSDMHSPANYELKLLSAKPAQHGMQYSLLGTDQLAKRLAQIRD